MIRKAIIILLTTLAVMMMAVWAYTWVIPIHIGRVSPSLIHVWNVRSGDLWLLAVRNAAAWDTWNGPVTEQRFWLRFLGFDTFSTGNGYARLEVKLNLLIPCVLFATYPAIAFIRGPFRRWRRLRNGWCIRCGYNLTGNVSGVCPECGKAT